MERNYDFGELVEKVKAFASSEKGKRKILEGQEKAQRDINELERRQYFDYRRLDRLTRI